MAFHDDPVKLTLNGETLAIVEHYEIREGLLQQPSSFSIRLGHGGVTRELLAKYPPNAQFQISIGPAPIMFGYVDGQSSGDGNGATQVTFEGRDLGARIHDAFIKAEIAFSQEKTYRDLLQAALVAVGLPEVPIFTDNAANRKAHLNRNVTQTAPSITEVTLDDGTAQEQIVPGTKKTVYQSIEAKLGVRWGEFLKGQFDRAGLFFWADGSGGMILSAPNANQDPAYRIVRRRGITDAPVNVTRHSFRNNIARRYTKCLVYGHGGGRNFGRTKIRGEFVDQEMSFLLGGEDVKPLIVHDTTVKTQKQAAFLAQRKIAEANRDGYQLNYTLAGHTGPALKGGANARAVWTPDTVVDVDDDELGIKRTFYVESCTHQRSPQTESTIHLMRQEDLFFGEPD